MKSILLASMLILLFTQPALAWRGKVAEISDGDTISVLHEGVSVRVTLASIDCPENHQAYGEKAKQKTSKLVMGKVVNVIEQKKDRYGRTIADVRFGGGRNLSKELVKSGFAIDLIRGAENGENPTEY